MSWIIGGSGFGWARRVHWSRVSGLGLWLRVMGGACSLFCGLGIRLFVLSVFISEVEGSGYFLGFGIPKP